MWFTLCLLIDCERQFTDYGSFSAGKQDLKQLRQWVQQAMTFRANYLSFQLSFYFSILFYLIFIFVLVNKNSLCVLALLKITFINGLHIYHEQASTCSKVVSICFVYMLSGVNICRYLLRLSFYFFLKIETYLQNTWKMYPSIRYQYQKTVVTFFSHNAIYANHGQQNLN